ncbi:phage portal protein [Bradyrhizobium sp. CCBAU 25338]|uniref:phage portal protein n=1 Tax=Bradyrhizobium sp. CCBAU 25338 TaxID=1641877 RepID=UPI002304313D|nr:phage portal protein [Bradyrhizobium sp. CCBAU 25338]MDA9530342.1 hypothetical protein [Bradyrhizobium sp. CCBAU 25338]
MRLGPFEFKLTRKSLGNPTADELALFSGGSTGQATPLDNTAVAMAVRLVSEACAVLQPNVVTRGAKPEQVDHSSLTLLRGEANPWTSGFELVRDLVGMALLSDSGGLAWCNRVDDKPVEIIRYDFGRIAVQYAGDGSGEPTYSIDGRQLDPRDVIHVRSPFSKSPVNLARGAINAAASMEKHVTGLFEKGARPGGVIEFPGKLGDEGLKKMKSAWRAAFEGADNAGRTAVLWDAAKFTALTMASTDAQFLENRLFQLSEIARAFNMSPTMLGDLTKSSYANASQKQLEFLVYAVEPWLCALESAFNRALLSDDERATMTFRFDRDDLTRASLTERATAINSLIASETINPNEGRDWLGLDPYTGGETYGNRNITTKPATVPANE